LVDAKEKNKALRNKFKGIKTKPLIFSSITGFGLAELLDILWENLEND
jgi:hypothetical protein